MAITAEFSMAGQARSEPKPRLANSPATSKRTRILMLHGYTQSGELFRAKVRALEKYFDKAFPDGVDFHYLTAPLRLRAADMPTSDDDEEGGEDGEEEELNAFGWWKKRVWDKQNPTADELDRMEECFESVADVLVQYGPFDGIIGFSQGAALAGLVASLLEPGRPARFEDVAAEIRRESGPDSSVVKFPVGFLRRSDGPESTTTEAQLVHPPVKFVVAYSGFKVMSKPYSPFYEPKISTPLMSVVGSNDTTVEESRSLALAEAADKGTDRDRLFYHPGGHFVPASQKMSVFPVISFVKQQLEAYAVKCEEI